MHTLDTNSVIYYLKGLPAVAISIEAIYAQGGAIYISAITEAELFSFSGLTEEESARIDAFLKTVFIVPIDSRIARLMGMIRRVYHLKTPDSAIAATTLFTGSTLLTRNIRDFKRVNEIRVQKI
ncbi:MAG: hypothetical protein A3J58_00140 [Candidatus Sungbacteria bacterium RIFCSPHIGHO2_02_FULL_52_23]|uniref:PIN domain-containing protein n=1 Tax=Candidatus Sungbacteria bacterium RIFCSPHIGHO2_02_FULL_52_23 TaxID=1802274 RepID=A0A1G2KWZ6_9BACT|nr:MAG: hypothetical protein A3J58_00140 [Candidatus Sungbacteria bacterium RIFCSPHIGHO2_02_FULL_52_23]